MKYSKRGARKRRYWARKRVLAAHCRGMEAMLRAKPSMDRVIADMEAFRRGLYGLGMATIDLRTVLMRGEAS